MHYFSRRDRRHSLLSAAAVLLLAAPAGVDAQAWSYPAFQTPRVTGRELNFGLADGGPGTTLLFQWREGRSARSQLSLDVGFTDDAWGGFREDDEVFFLGGQFGQQLATSSPSMPFDILLTVGANFAVSDPVRVFRIPVGVSLGHRFPLEGLMAITPWIHPRISIDHFSWDRTFEIRRGVFVDDSDTDANVVVDLGGDFEFSPRFSLRVGATLGGGNFLDDAFGVSLAWRPGGSRAPVPRPTRRG
jgi:hypothetical protein